MPDEITAFRGEYAFLSNYYLCVVELDEVAYSSVEHAFQAAKTDNPDERYQIQIAPTPSRAKQIGRKVKLRADWESVKIGIMESLVRYKFTAHGDLRALLLATDDAHLIEGNTWNDRIYGAVWSEKSQAWMGQNHLGKILMKVRDELREGS